jgi:hypothetical protein
VHGCNHGDELPLRSHEIALSRRALAHRLV